MSRGSGPSPAWPRLDRSAPDVLEQVPSATRALLPEFSDGDRGLRPRWRDLARLGAHDLVLARLVEGHLDAVTILHEAGRPVRSGAYGVWASASGGTGLRARRSGDRWRVDGTMRFASGVLFLDRALVVAAGPEDARLLLDVDVAAGRGHSLRPVPGTWPAVGMDGSMSLDVEVEGLEVSGEDVVGPPGFYLDRPGFVLGGAGVAAVWLGGAQGLLDRAVTALHAPSPHSLAHLGAVRTAIAAAFALLDGVPDRLDDPDAVPLARAAADAAAGEALARLPRAVGAVPLSRDGSFAHHLADLQVYVRQHHAERDLEQLGDALVRAAG